MRQKYFLFLAAGLLVFLAGCSLLTSKAPEGKDADLNNSEKFALTEDEQDAVFYLGFGWVGSVGGNAPILDLDENRPKQWNGIPIFFDGTRVQEALDRGGMPECVVGRPLTKVAARIKLEKKSEVNTSIPPDENGVQPSETFYEAKVLELKDVNIKAEECEE